jgi:lipoprotein-releasing system permease protein
MLTFPRTVAARYFALGKQRTWRVFIPTLVVVALLLLSGVFAYTLYHSHHPKLQQWRAEYGYAVLIARLALMVLVVLFLYFTILIWRITIFTSLSVFGVFIGAGALVIVLSIMSGFEHDLKRKILGNNAHVVVTMPDRRFTDYARVRDQLARLPGVIGATPYAVEEMMIASQTNMAGVVVKGIDPATVGQVTDLVRNTDVGGLEYLLEPAKLRGLGGPPIPKDDEPTDELEQRGAKDEPQKPEKDALHFVPAGKDGKPAPQAEPPAPARRIVDGIIIGRELHRSLRSWIGDDVNLISPFGGIGPSGAIPKSKPFRVAGIFYSGMFEYDTKHVYVTLAAAQKFFNMPGEATGIELKLADPERTEPVVAAAQRLLDKSYDVQDWKSLNRSLFSALKIEKILMFVLLSFIILVAAFSIIANGTMLVMEKGREVAILKSMGASDRAILGAFMALGLYIGGLGTVTGIAIGIVACLALAHFGVPLNSDVYYITTLPVKINPYEITVVFFAAIAIALLATLYPAWMAARLRPVEGLHDAR